MSRPTPPRDPEAHAFCSQCGSEIAIGEVRYRQGCESCGKLVTVCALCVSRKKARPEIVSIGCPKHPGYMP